MKAFVIGATGETGQRIVKELVSCQIPVRALVRDLAKAKAILPSNVELVVGDVLKSSQLSEAIANSTVLICATGTRPSLDITGPYQVDYIGTRNLIDIAKDMGIQHFVLISSLCVSQIIHPLNLFWLFLFWKKKAEDYLIGSGLTYTIIRPGGLINEDNLNPIIMSGPDTLFDGRIPRIKVAQIAVSALTHPSSYNKILEVVTQPEATPLSWDELFKGVTSV